MNRRPLFGAILAQASLRSARRAIDGHVLRYPHRQHRKLMTGWGEPLFLRSLMSITASGFWYRTADPAKDGKRAGTLLSRPEKASRDPSESPSASPGIPSL